MENTAQKQLVPPDEISETTEYHSQEEMVQTDSGRFFLKDSDREFVQTDSGRFVFKSPDRTYSYVLPKSDWSVHRKRSYAGTFFTFLALAFAIGFAALVVWQAFFVPNPIIKFWTESP